MRIGTVFFCVCILVGDEVSVWAAETPSTAQVILRAHASERPLAEAVYPNESHRAHARFTIVAGPGLPGDGAAATAAFLPYPGGTAIDAAGRLYVSELWTGRIRVVEPDGKIRTYAGTGVTGFGGDGGPAVNARLNYPRGITIDGEGSLYIADSGNNRIRRVAPDGTITTVAGTGERGFGGDGGPATLATFSSPYDVACDSRGNLFIADYGNNRIREVTADGFVRTVGGNGIDDNSGDGGSATSAALSAPKSLAVAPDGDLYIPAFVGDTVRKISGGIITTAVGTGTYGYSGDGGPAAAAKIAGPEAVAVDASGILYIADTWNERIRCVTPDGIINTVAGTGAFGYSGDGGSATGSVFAYPLRVTADAAGNVYVADFGNARIRRFAIRGTIATIAGSDNPMDNAPAAEGRILNPSGLAVGPDGTVFVSDTGFQRVRSVSADGLIHTVAGDGTMGSSGDGGPATKAELNGPMGLAVDAAGNLHIADSINHSVRTVGTDGTIRTLGGRVALQRPSGVAADAAGAVYIADAGRHMVFKVAPGGTTTTVAGTGLTGFSGDGGPGISAALNSPAGVAVDAAGNVYVADTGNNRIRRVALDGTITTIAGTGVAGSLGDGGLATEAQLNEPAGVAADLSGNVYIADTQNSRVRLTRPDGSIRTVAGPEDGIAMPQAVALDAAGRVYVCDTRSLRVLMLTSPDPSSRSIVRR
jgi:sugar lactone lactonase YvrE